MEVEPEVALAHEPVVHPVGHPLGRVRALLPRERAVEVLVVDGDVPLLCLVGGDVHDVEQHQRPVEVGGSVPVGHLLEHLHAVEFVAVDRGGHEHPRSGLVAVEYRHRDLDRVAEVRLAHLVPELALLAGSDLAVVPERPGLVGDVV